MKRKVIVISLLAIIASLSIATVSNAAIQIKPTEGNVHTNINLSNAYQYCYDMRNASSSLGVNNLDPHLTLNKDWGAAAYLAISAYGDIRNRSGNSVTIGSYGYNSTTGNVTGVMCMGRTSTFTASIQENRINTDLSNLANIKNNVNTKFVEILPASDIKNRTKGYAMHETEKWYTSYVLGYNTSDETYVRRYVLEIAASEGESSSTFRPVIWNK